MSQSHYFDSDPAVRSRPATIELVLPDYRTTLQTDRGVFSAGAVDAGTVELLKATRDVLLSEPATVLDLGCGYGPIACTIGHRYPAASVWAIDVNERAVALTRTNASALCLTNVTAALPDGIGADLTFDAIWSNPPIRIGKVALHDLLLRWLPRLAAEGTAWMVVQRNLGADSLASWLSGGGWSVARVGSKRGYRILRVQAGRP